MVGPHHESRHYTVLGLIGRGGQGNVYHARMEGSEGFRKDVAIKLLKEGLPEESVHRFRDEARILGLVHDRSIITVDPPIRLGGRWAIVMEYVEGASVNRLLKGGGLPVGVALDIVIEIARILGKVYQTPGPDGRPLCLIHRDIKPGNLQISSEGEVKLLDFGVARADFEDREALTVAHIGGTYGFIAPERIRGVNGPECDIYSLGVTLRVMLTAERPTDLTPLPDEPIGPVLALAEKMRDPDPAARPIASEVERRARELRAIAPGPSLRDWAAEVVPALKASVDDPLVGMVLTESVEYEPMSGLSAHPVPVETTQPTRSTRPTWLALVLPVALLLVAGIVAVGFAAIQLGSALQAPDPAPPPVVAAPAAPVVIAVEPPAPPVERPLSSSPPAALSPPPPTPVRPAAPIVAMDVTSKLPARVWIDGVEVGSTALHRLEVPAGTHRVKLVAASGASVEATVLVGGRHGATSFDWDGGPVLGAR